MRPLHITTLLLNLDNGPENHSHRIQFMHQLLAFARQSGLITGYVSVSASLNEEDPLP
jgi:hypothetical protein